MKFGNQDQRLRVDRACQRGAARTIVLVVVFFVLGLVAGAWWYHPRGKEPTAPAEPTVQLSDASKEVLAHLSQPVEMRFYSLLDPGAPGSLKEFSGYVGRLLSAYERQTGGKIVVNRFDSGTNANPNAALADGLKGFNLDKGEGCYLGLALAANGRKEVLAQLAPEWQPAVEADISRALQRLNAAPPGANPSAATLSGEMVSSSIAAVKQLLPDYASVSMEDGTRTLREAGLREFSAAVIEMKAHVQEAQQRLEQARSNGSPADQESAVKNLQDVQRAQSDKLGEVAARSQALIAAFQQLKAQSK